MTVAQLCLTLCDPMDCSVQFSRSVVSDSLRPHESQHTRPPCPSPSPGVHSNSHPSSWCCHPAVSSSVIPFSSRPPIPPSIIVFSNESTLCMRWPKYWSFSFSIIPSKEHCSPWNSPGHNTGVGSLSLLQGISPTQGLNPGPPHYRWILYQLSHKGSPDLSLPNVD